VQTLRINQIAAEVYPDVSKLKKQLEYADRKKIPYAIVIGSDEVKTGNLTMKNMKTGEQHQRSLTEILASF
jgi:histidyl-tRNA synthetase